MELLNIQKFTNQNLKLTVWVYIRVDSAQGNPSQKGLLGTKHQGQKGQTRHGPFREMQAGL